MSGVHERDLGAPVRRFLEGRGYRVWVDPDGSDYLDVVARRNDELGLVELKLADWRKVLAQAIRRRGWADWAAVLVPRPTLAAKILAAPQAPRAQRIGIWTLAEQEVRVVRESRPLWSPGEPHPFPELRARLLEMTDLLAAGGLGEGVRWELPGSKGRLPGGRRSTRDWRLEEFPAD